MKKSATASIVYFFVDKSELLMKAGYQFYRLVKGQTPSSLSIKYLKFKRRNPKTFNEKIQYKIAYDRSPRLSLFADKIAVRDYVADKIGTEFLTDVYSVFHSSSDLSFKNAPRNFVLKPNHVSGAALVVADFVSKSGKKKHLSRRNFKKYYMNPDLLNEKGILGLVDFWLKTSYFGYHRTAFPEWAYKAIVPCVYIEELLSTNNQPPEDFRFFMFDGKCQVVMVDTPGFAGVRRDIYSPEWNYQNVQFGYPNSRNQRERPDNLNQMIEIAQELSYGVDHLRVDLYNIAGRIVFSELTNYHAGGTQTFSPRSFDLELGRTWNPKKWY
jgi:hypothetical protein